MAPDGTAYVPNPSCNRQGNPLVAGEPGFARSSNAGITWDIRTVGGAQTSGSSDPALGIGADGTLYPTHQGRGLELRKNKEWVELSNPDGVLKPGLPADAVILTSDAGN